MFFPKEEGKQGRDLWAKHREKKNQDPTAANCSLGKTEVKSKAPKKINCLK